MPKKCLNHPDIFLCVCVCLCVLNWPSNLRGETLPLSLINVMSFIVGVKCVTKTNVGPLHLSRSVYGASHTMGKWFAPNAVLLSHSLEGIGRPLIQLLLLFKQHNRNHPQIQTNSEISKSAISNKAVPTQVRISCTKSSGKLTFSKDDSDSGDDHEQQECRLRSNIWSKLFLVWTTLINTRRF
jgi:hypothetical protein